MSCRNTPTIDIYLYDVLILNDGANEQDMGFINIANSAPVPADGKVKRILDLGTGVGQLATSLKKRTSLMSRRSRLKK